MTQTILGYVMIVVGLSLIVIQVAVLLGVIKKPGGDKTLSAAGWADVFLALIEKLPPLFIVGLLLI